MQIQVFAVAATGSPESASQLNAFLRTRRVLSVERKLVEAGCSSFWSFCVEYLEAPAVEGRGVGKIDYREILPPEQFERFARLRALRKDLAEKEGVPPYAVFTNEQLAQIVRLPQLSLAAVEAIEGIGPARVAKYGASVLAALHPKTEAASGETSGTSDGANRRP